jgi:hypothetical protein
MPLDTAPQPLPTNPIPEQDMTELKPEHQKMLADVLNIFFPTDEYKTKTALEGKPQRESPRVIFYQLMNRADEAYPMLNKEQQAFLQALQTLQQEQQDTEFCPSWITQAWSDAGHKRKHNILDISLVSIFIPAMFEYLSECTTCHLFNIASFNQQLSAYVQPVRDQVVLTNQLHFYLAENLAQEIEARYTDTKQRLLKFEDTVFNDLLSLIPFGSITALMQFTRLFYQLLAEEKEAATRTALVQHVFPLYNLHGINEIFKEGGQLFQLQVLSFYLIRIYEDLNYAFDEAQVNALGTTIATVLQSFKEKQSTLPEKISILLRRIEQETLPLIVDALATRSQALSMP